MTRSLAVTLAAVASVLAVGVIPVLAKSGATIFFWSDRGGPALYTMRSDGSRVRLLYETQQNAKRPVPSPDGRWIAFDGAAPGKPVMRAFDVQIMRRDGTRRRTLAGSPAFEVDAQWSPSGLQLSYSKQPAGGDWRRSTIWVVRPDGSGRRRVSRGQFARWSPDGRTLALDAPTSEGDGDLFLVALDGRVLRRLTKTPELEQPAAWSPDGSQILFTRFATGGGSDVFVIRADGTRARRLTRARGEDVAADWSPDGRRILFTSERTGRQQVHVMNADGSGQRNLSRNRFDDVATSWG